MHYWLSTKLQCELVWSKCSYQPCILFASLLPKMVSAHVSLSYAETTFESKLAKIMHGRKLHFIIFSIILSYVWDFQKDRLCWGLFEFSFSLPFYNKLLDHRGEGVYFSLKKLANNFNIWFGPSMFHRSRISVSKYLLTLWPTKD